MILDHSKTGQTLTFPCGDVPQVTITIQKILHNSSGLSAVWSTDYASGWCDPVSSLRSQIQDWLAGRA